MKRYLILLAAATFVACSNEELSTPENNLATSQAPVNFEVYTQRGLTRAGVPGTIDNDNIGTHGFGVFAYYTAGENYGTKATPNFMYNQQVTKGTGDAKWTYEPVKYWPNEFGTGAKSNETDRLSFFAYAPWTDVDPTTGNVIGTTEKEQSYNIVAVNMNTATGDPLVKYVVDTDPATSVDLLWGVAADNTTTPYYSAITGATDLITEGKPFIDLVKPGKPDTDLMSFNLKHALAKIKVTIDFIADAATPDGPSSDTFYPEETRIYVRSFQMNGFALKGALNLNNTTPGEPLWKDFDGATDLAFDDVIFQDGRKDGKEGQVNGAQTNETPQGLNPQIVENFCLTENGQFAAGKTSGVTSTPQLLFDGTQSDTDNGYFYIIPRNEGTSSVDVTIVYDVETIDSHLKGKLSDGETHGISIENVITKEDIFNGIDFNAGMVYEIKIHLGMTSVKIDATVTEWDSAIPDVNVDLPTNQGIAATALRYQYPDGYQYHYYEISVDGNDINATYYLGTDNQDILHDIARFLGALYRASGVQEIEYNGTTYHWDPATAGNLKGSNWVNDGGNTLVSVIAAGGAQNSLTIKADGQEINFNMSSVIVGGGAGMIDDDEDEP